MINKKGSMTIFSFGVCVLILTLFILIMIYLQNYSILKNIHESMQATILTVATENFDETYFSKREAASGGFIRQAEWTETVDNGAAVQQLKEILNLSQSENRLVKKDSYNKVHYELSDIRVIVYNSSFQSDNNIRAEIYCTVSIPTKGLTFKSNLRASSAWKQKY